MIYCYVTGEQCSLIKTADIGDEIDGIPVREHGDYEAWELDESETNEMVFRRSGYHFLAARAVQGEMGWPLLLWPIRDQLRQEIARIVDRDNESFTASDVMMWTDSNVDESDMILRNGFYLSSIAEDLVGYYAHEQVLADYYSVRLHGVQSNTLAGR